MKRFALVLAICGPLCVGAASYATDFVWAGGTSAVFNLNANWTGAGFPASGAPSRVIDRATIDVVGTFRPLFINGNDGIDNSSYMQLLLVDASTNSPGTFISYEQDSGKALFRGVKLLAGGAASEDAVLNIDGGFFQTDYLICELEAEGAGSCDLDAQVNVIVSAQTEIRPGAEFNCRAEIAGVVVDLGYISMGHESTLNSGGPGVCESS